MRYRSTRGSGPVGLDQALIEGIAPDGGLFVPQELPSFKLQTLLELDDIQSTARTVLEPFFSESVLHADLDGIIAETFCFPIPVTDIGTDGSYAGLLELYHGPTAAFKDVGAAFLAACLSRLEASSESPLTILVATSGDTGGAVAAAFDGRPGIRVVVLFPEGRVSARQEHQLTCWGDNVLSLSVRGSFDDCQALVKSAMADDELATRYRFSSANSINIGRLLPQCIYFAHSSIQHHRRHARNASFIVPTGNMGNVFACIMARAMGMPIDDIIMATNENDLIVDFLGGEPWESRASIQTLASAMDVGNPSNMERLLDLMGEGEELRRSIAATRVSDEQIEEQIRRRYRDFGFAVCPHTATAMHAYDSLAADVREQADWILVATAHAAKFEQIVEPLIGAAVPLPPALQQILSRPSRSLGIDPDLASLDNALQRNFSA
jgi:threonine synthase